MFLEELKESKEVGVGSYVELENGLNLLVLPFFGGEVIKIDGKEINVITPKTPIYKVVEGRKEGDEVILLNGAKTRVRRVL